MKRILPGIGLVAILQLAGCAPTLKVTADYDHAADFSQYKTFMIYDLSTKKAVSELNVARVTKAIRANMVKKGFVEVTENPDMMVNATSILKNKQTVTANTTSYGYGGYYRPYGYWGGGVGFSGGTTTFDTYDYVDGSLIIDVVNSKEQKLLWQGIGNAEIDKKPNDPEKFINDAVAKIMDGFPPKP